MKVVKIILVSCLVFLLLAILAVFVILKTVDLNPFKSQITDEISRSLRREVNIASLDFAFSLKEGIGLAINGLEIADDAGFQKQKFLKAGRVTLALDLLPILLERKIVVAQVTVDSFEVSLIHNREGRFNFERITVKSAEPSGNSQTPSLPAGSTPSAVEKGSLPQFQIRSIVIQHGALVYVDEALDPTLRIPIQQIELSVKDFQLRKPFLFRVKAALFAQERNVEIQGNAIVDDGQHQVSLTDVSFQSDVAKLDFGELQAIFPQVPFSEQIKAIEGKLMLKVKNFEAGQLGVKKIDAAVEFSEGRLSLKVIPLIFDQVSLTSRMTEKDVKDIDLRLKAGQGTVSAQGSLKDYLGNQDLQLNLLISDLGIQYPLLELGSNAAFVGVLKGDFSATGQVGTKISRDFLSGRGQVAFEQARLVDFNVLNFVLNKIPFISGLFDQILADFPIEDQDKLKAKDTVFQKMVVELSVGQGRVFLDEVAIQSDLFSLMAKGSLDLDQNLSLQGDVYIPAILAERMVKVVPELAGLVTADQMIKIPLLPYQGKISSLKLLPDLEYITQRMVVERGKLELQKVIGKNAGVGKILGTIFGNGDESSGQETAPSDTSGKGHQAGEAEEAIKNILNSILH